MLPVQAEAACESTAGRPAVSAALCHHILLLQASCVVVGCIHCYTPYFMHNPDV